MVSTGALSGPGVFSEGREESGTAYSDSLEVSWPGNRCRQEHIAFCVRDTLVKSNREP